MHELSIVHNILQIAIEEVNKTNAVKVDQIDLDIGILSGIEIEALDFAWRACTKNTVLEGAKRNIFKVDAFIHFYIQLISITSIYLITANLPTLTSPVSVDCT